MIESFLNYLAYEKTYSTCTVTSYSHDLSKFEQFLKKEGKTFQNVTYPDIRDYLFFLKNCSYSSRTICRNISVLRTFFHYLNREKIREDNPMELIQNPKEVKKLPKFLYPNDLEKLLETPNLKEEKECRDALILELLYATGLRVSELVSIKIEDIHPSEQTIKVLGKGNKERYVFYGKRTQNLLNQYKFEERKGYLFLEKNRPLTTNDIRKIINIYEKRAGLKMHVTPHMIRHTFATDLLNEGASLLTVKELLGHENLSTTSIYTHISNEKLRQVYHTAHPRAKKTSEGKEG